MTDDIASITVAAGPCRKTGGSTSGEQVTMADGSVWFHPYNGGAPTLLKAARETGGGND